MIYALAFVFVVGAPSPALGGLTLGAWQPPDRLVYADQPRDLWSPAREQYMQRRWRKMCRGPERYQAMQEAYEAGGANPC